MKAKEAKAELLKIEGNKMLDAAILEIKKGIKNGEDQAFFRECESDTVAGYLARELKKLGYKTSCGENYLVIISWG